MTRTPHLTVVLCLALSPAVFPIAAKAEPRVLTAAELAAVTAGRAILPSIQINVNNAVQIARATAVSIAICTTCTDATVTAFSEATAFNVNLAELTNLAF
jgi:cobalamin biosynthesis protein CobT